MFNLRGAEAIEAADEQRRIELERALRCACGAKLHDATFDRGTCSACHKAGRRKPEPAPQKPITEETLDPGAAKWAAKTAPRQQTPAEAYGRLFDSPPASPAAPPPAPAPTQTEKKKEHVMPRKHIKEATKAEVLAVWNPEKDSVNALRKHFIGSYYTLVAAVKAHGFNGGTASSTEPSAEVKPAAAKASRKLKSLPAPAKEGASTNKAPAAEPWTPPAAEPRDLHREVKLPEPELLPPAYLLQCVAFALRFQAELAAALSGTAAAEPAARSAA